MTRQHWILAVLGMVVAGVLNGLGVDHGPALLTGIVTASAIGFGWNAAAGLYHR